MESSASNSNNENREVEPNRASVWAAAWEGVDRPDNQHISPAFVAGLVSVILPTYNRRHLVLESLESVVAQSYRPIELIVVDDGSTDGTAAALTEWIGGLNGTRREGLELQVICQSNHGYLRARNRGLCASHGEFIQFLDSDDLLHPQKLSVQVEALKNDATLAFAYSSIAGFTSTPNWESSGGGVITRDVRLADVAGLNGIQGVFRRSVCREIGPWDPQTAPRDDLEYHMRLFSTGRPIAFVSGVYSAGRSHGGGRITTSATAEAALHALRVAAERLDASGRDDGTAGEFLASQFFRTGLGAVARGEIGVAREAARWGLRYPCSQARRWKLWALAALSAPMVPDALRRKTIERMLKFVRRRS